MNDQIPQIDIKLSDRVVFIHIPKTAGDTFGAMIDPLLSGLPRCSKTQTGNLVKLAYDEIVQYRLFMGHSSYDQMELLFPSGFLTMTFLREPIRRTVSQFKYLQRYEEIKIPIAWKNRDVELQMIKNMTLDEFVVNTTFYDARMITNLQTRILGGVACKRGQEDDHTQSMSVRLEKLRNRYDGGDPDDECLEIAKERLAQAAFFGITERFQDSLFLLSFTFGWPPLIDSLWLNRAPDSHRLTKLHPTTIALIQDRVDLDIQLYDFAQKLFEQRFNAMTESLLQKYGNDKQKNLKAPLPADLMVELLQKHYETRRDNRNRETLESIGPSYFYSPSSYSEGAFGWYPVEVSPEHGAMRWSGPGVNSGLDLPLPAGKNIQLSFCVLMALQPEIINGLSITVNGVLVDLRCETDARRAFIFTGQVPAHAISGPFVRLVFSVPQTIAPCAIDTNNGDSRQLGILLNWIKLEEQI